MMGEKSFANISEYILAQPNETQPVLQKIYAVIKANAPDAQERMSWQMPTFWQGENLIHFALGKSHVGIYPGPDAVINFTDRLASYKTSKGAIQFPLNKPIDYDLIGEITRWRVVTVEGENA
jgi:uncharacterized protein YdhG (YjbR/CyaY superfamily)